MYEVRCMMHSSNRSHFQTKQLSVGHRSNFARQTWTCCQSCIWKSFPKFVIPIYWNDWILPAKKKSPNNSKCDHTFTHIKAWAILCMLMTLKLCPDSNAASFERLHLKIECAMKAVPIQRWNASFDSWAMKDTADRSFMVQTIPRFIVCQKMLDYTFKLKY